MMRKTIVVGMTLLAILLSGVGSVGYFVPIYQGFSATSRVHGYVYFSDGLLRWYWYLAAEEIGVTPSAQGRVITVRRAKDDTVCLRIRHAWPNQVGAHALVSQVFRPRRTRTMPTIHLVGVRTSVSLPVALLLIYPLLVLIRARRERHRQRAGYCSQCGYNLTGNISGLCPECGAAVDERLHGEASDVPS